MSDEQDPKSIPETEQSQGVETAAAPAAEAKPDYKEALVKELMEAAKADEAAPEPKKEEAKEETPAPEPKAEEKKDEPAKEEEKEETPEPAEEDDDLKGPADTASQSEKVAWGKLKAKLKKTQEEGQFGHILAQVGMQAGITPDEMANWVGLGARMRSGDPTAKTDLMRMIGVNPTPPKPAEPEVSPEDKVYTELFADAVNSNDMTEEAARAKSKAIAAKYHPPEPVETAPEPQRQYVDPVEAAASMEIDKLDVQYAAKVPKWDKLREEVFGIIATRHSGAPAIQWLPLFNETVREVQAKYAKPVEKPRVKPDQALKPSATSSAASDAANWKANLAADMMSGRF